jgi:hypothetical protein
MFGRGSPGKMPIVAAVETIKEGRPARIKTRRATALLKKHIKNLAKRIVADRHVVCD